MPELADSPPKLASRNTAHARSEMLIDVRIMAIRFLTETINLFELSQLGRDPLPGWEPGAHIDLHLRGGLVRQYSLVDTCSGAPHYHIAVKRETSGRGGSRTVHDLRVGQTIEISAPRNNFELVSSSAQSILFAGGIGITPIISMVQKLRRDQRPWALHYCARSQSDMAFHAALAALPAARLWFDDHNPGCFLDIAAIVAELPAEAHLYCCGPSAMMDAFERATSTWPREQVHTEYFANRLEPATAGGFIVQLARSGNEFAVPKGKTILQVLKENGVPAPSSCEEGICGTCEIRVISGIPEHRDRVLSDIEKAQNKSMMICCSGSKSERLVLDF